MAQKAFILGRPGCGKSAAVRNISRLAQYKGWQPEPINDYRILNDMFQKEQIHLVCSKRRFRPSDHNGFDVEDFSVLDDALREVEKRVNNRIAASQSSKQKLIFIEFARNDYREALSLFNKEFLQDAYFLFIHADIDTCVQRVRARSVHPNTEDDHFVSEYIIRNYYSRDITPAIISDIESTFRLDDQRVRFIDSNDTWDKFLYDVRGFSSDLLNPPSTTSRKTEPLTNSFSSSVRYIKRNLVEIV